MTSKAKIKIFGTDGVRGRANSYPMTVEIALALGRAAGKIFRPKRKASRGHWKRYASFLLYV